MITKHIMQRNMNAHNPPIAMAAVYRYYFIYGMVGVIPYIN